LTHRRDERVLHGLLGHVDVAEPAHQDRNRPPMFGTEDPLDVDQLTSP
jgi:hypothetical protein